MCRSTLWKSVRSEGVYVQEYVNVWELVWRWGATWEDWLGEPGARCHPGKRTQLRLLGTPGRQGLPLKQDRWGKA